MTASLADLLAASRVFALREAVVATLKAALPVPPCEVKAHPGRLDMKDVEEGTMFSPPAVHIGVTRIDPAEGRMSGYRDVPVEVSAYVVTADTVIGDRAVHRDELALALQDAVLSLVEDPGVARWGLADIDLPENATAYPLFTAQSFDRGTAYYAVTWRQTLYSLGRPILDFEAPVPPDAAGTVVFPAEPISPLTPPNPGWLGT